MLCSFFRKSRYQPIISRAYSSVVVVLVLYLTFASIASASVTEDELAFDDVTIQVSDMLTRLGYRGEPISYALLNRTRVKSVAQASRPIEITAIRGERENFQLLLFTDTEGISVNQIKLAALGQDAVDLKSTVKPEIQVYVIGDLEGIDQDGKKIGPFPDVLLPVDERDQIDSFGGIRLLVSITSKNVPTSGLFDSELLITLSNGKSIGLPLKIKLLKAEIPKIATLNTNLFSLDTPSLGYWYGLGPDSDLLGKLIDDSSDLLIQHRFAPSKAPVRLERSSNSSPVPNSAIKTGLLELDKDNRRTTAGPMFSDLGSAFSISTSLQTARNTVGNVLSHRWFGRDSGYLLSLENNHLIFSAKVAELRHPDSEKRQKYHQVMLAAQWPQDEKEHTVRVDVNQSVWTIYIDDAIASSIEVTGPIEDAPGAWLTFGPLSQKFAIKRPSWVSRVRSKDADEILPFYFDAFEENVSLKLNDMRLLTTDRYEDWLQKTVEEGQFVNDFRWRFERNPFTTSKRIRSLEQSILNRGFVSLPFDEATTGGRLKKNLTFARHIKNESPLVRRLHTLGSMRVTHPTRSKRLAALRVYEGNVDIWSARMSLLTEQKEFFDARLKAGDELSPYIHNVNIVENEDVLILGRIFLSRLGALGISHVSFWNTTLWFQPSNANRPMRNLEETPFGFKVSKRNPSGIGAGMIFYPGKSGLLSSLRAIGWQDGIEDLEMLRYVEGIDRSTIRRQKQLELEALLETLAQSFGEYRHVIEVRTSDAKTIKYMRKRLESILEGL